MSEVQAFARKWVFDNQVQAWKQANFATYTMNSVFLSLAVMLISLINASMAGYVFARKNFKGGKELLHMLFHSIHVHQRWFCFPSSFI